MAGFMNMSRFHQWANQASFNAKSAKEKEFAKFLNEKLQEKLGAEYQYFGTVRILIQEKGLLIIVEASYGEKARLNYDFATKEVTTISSTGPSPKQTTALKESLEELMATQEVKEGGGKHRSKKARKTKKVKRSKKSKTKRAGKKRA